jgi:hypothetical protein
VARGLESQVSGPEIHNIAEICHGTLTVLEGIIGATLMWQLKIPAAVMKKL